MVVLPWMPLSTAKNIALVDSKGYLYITTDFSATSPTWESTQLSLIDVYNDPVAQFVVDPFSPHYTGQTPGVVDGWIVTQQRIYRLPDIFGSNPDVLLPPHDFLRSTAWRNIDFSSLEEGWGIAIANYASTPSGIHI